MGGFADREAVMPPLLLEPPGSVPVVLITDMINDVVPRLPAASVALHCTV
jgi:hypothetical protein